MNHIIFNSRDQLYRLEIAKIVYFEADGNYTTIVMTNKLKAVVLSTLGNVEKALATQLKDEAAIFMRVGKRFIINRRYIYEVNLAKQHLVLSDFSNFAFQLPVSKAALKNVKDIMTRTKD